PLFSLGVSWTPKLWFSLEIDQTSQKRLHRHLPLSYWRTQLSRLIFRGFYGASFLRFSAFHLKPLLEFSRTLQPQFNLSHNLFP
ncbi:hypothetical protein GOODEAATRI_027437, partial [Goodea atripinnis]